MTIFRLNFLLKVGQMKVCQNPSFISTNEELCTGFRAKNFTHNWKGLNFKHRFLARKVFGRFKKRTPGHIIPLPEYPEMQVQ